MILYPELTNGTFSKVSGNLESETYHLLSFQNFFLVWYITIHYSFLDGSSLMQDFVTPCLNCSGVISSLSHTHLSNFGMFHFKRSLSLISAHVFFRRVFNYWKIVRLTVLNMDFPKFKFSLASSNFTIGKNCHPAPFEVISSRYLFSRKCQSHTSVSLDSSSVVLSGKCG